MTADSKVRGNTLGGGEGGYHKPHMNRESAIYSSELSLYSSKLKRICSMGSSIIHIFFMSISSTSKEREPSALVLLPLDILLSFYLSSSTWTSPTFVKINVL